MPIKLKIKKTPPAVRVPPKDLDLTARKVIMSAFLYYRCDDPILSDGEYDKMVAEVASWWDDLLPARQWQLVSAEDLRASGYHVRVTSQSLGGALSWYRDIKRRRLKGHWPDHEDMAFDEEFRTRWFRAGG